MTVLHTAADAWPGLSEGDAASRRQVFGFNDIQDIRRRSFWSVVKGVATEPMFGLLIAASVIYLFIGDLAEGALLALFACVSIGLVVLQERRSERALDALRELRAPRARVRRDGAWRSVLARELVPGDVVLVSEGDRVAADAVLRSASGVAVDESLLSGESVPVDKRAQVGVVDLADGSSRTHDATLIFAGTLVVRGHGIAEVLATGRRSQLGLIGDSLASIEVAPTPLERQLRSLVRLFAIAALLSCAAVLAWYGVRWGQWLHGALAAIALGMSMLPEEFPMVLAVFFALGAWRMSRIQVLVRRPAVIEALGAVTVLCVDKTGTLTENRMALRRLATQGGECMLAASRADMLSEPDRQLLMAARLATRAESADAMHGAVLVQAQASLAQEQALAGWTVVRHYPLTEDLLAMANLWISPDGRHRLAAKGATEAIATLCRLDAEHTAVLMGRMHDMAGQGLRVIAVAQAVDCSGVEERLQDYRYELLGRLGFEDPLRSSVPAAMKEAHDAGIAVTMITGDHATTAIAIARQAGIDVGEGAVEGSAITAMGDEALRDAVRRTRVFARVRPEQKLRIVRALRANGEVVAMTGDGVNDAPALKAAHIGVAMGARGTDVAREAAGIVLLDDDFSRIVGGVRLGRRIYDNLRRAITYIIAIHVPIAGLALLPLLAGLPAVMLPVHVVLTEMVIDPMCSLVFEGAPEQGGIMRRPPRRASSVLVAGPLVMRGVAQGVVVLAAALAVDVAALAATSSPEMARGLAILSLTVGNLVLVAMNAVAGVGLRALAGAGLRAYWLIAAGASLVLGLLVLFPGGRRLLQIELPSMAMLTAAMAAVLLPLAALAAGQAVARRRSRE